MAKAKKNFDVRVVYADGKHENYYLCSEELFGTLVSGSPLTVKWERTGKVTNDEAFFITSSNRDSVVYIGWSGDVDVRPWKGGHTILELYLRVGIDTDYGRGKPLSFLIERPS
jgi:hypothetical protein